jgi:hypothetical protein
MTLQAPSWFAKPVPHALLLFGVVLIFLGVVYTCMGESYEKFHGWIYRSKEPKEFWWSIVGYYLTGISCIVIDVFDLPLGFVLAVLFVAILLHLVYLLIRWVIRQKR